MPILYRSFHSSPDRITNVRARPGRTIINADKRLRGPGLFLWMEEEILMSRITTGGRRRGVVHTRTKIRTLIVSDGILSDRPIWSMTHYNTQIYSLVVYGGREANYDQIISI